MPTSPDRLHPSSERPAGHHRPAIISSSLLTPVPDFLGPGVICVSVDHLWTGWTRRVLSPHFIDKDPEARAVDPSLRDGRAGAAHSDRAGVLPAERTPPPRGARPLLMLAVTMTKGFR